MQQLHLFPDVPPPSPPRGGPGGVGRRVYTVQLLTPEYAHIDAVCARYGCDEATAIEMAVMVGVRELLKGWRD